MINIILNFILFPTVAWMLGVAFSIPLFLSLTLSFLLVTVAPLLQIYANKDALIIWLKSLTIGVLVVLTVLGSYELLLLYGITSHFLPEIRNDADSQTLFLSALLIFALFVYYLLLSQVKTEKKQSLDQQLNQVLLRPSIALCLLVACILTVLELLLVDEGAANALSWIAPKLLERGIIPPMTLLLFNWGLLLLIGKWLILLKEGSQNRHSLLLVMLDKPTDDFWDKVWLKSDAFYILPNYINYALPILGFIGTVLGISLSAENIADIIASPDGLTANNKSLGDAIIPLGIAFDTTLIALSLGLILTLIFVLLKSMEVRIFNQLKQLNSETEN
ncbi:MAG: hypothetical protein HFP76_08445 [Methylococcales symbiont of Iophon sp. n. MRB-2018]|nr:MAG: hypothetical protein HFP76_08445 [Methylococcales symbiont of Iophon sp. n. MRB-2018]